MVEFFVAVVDDDLESECVDELSGLGVLIGLLIEGDLDDIDSVSVYFDSGRDLTGRSLAGVSPPIEPLKVENLSF